jgi:hypothetical protein
MRKLVTVSVPQEKLGVLDALKTVARREAGPKGFSQTAVKAWSDYVQAHAEGNPQLKILSYLPNTEKGPLRVLCWNHLAGATSDGKIYCRKHGGTWILGVTCYSCKNNELRKKKEP